MGSGKAALMAAYLVEHSVVTLVGALVAKWVAVKVVQMAGLMADRLVLWTADKMAVRMVSWMVDLMAGQWEIWILWVWMSGKQLGENKAAEKGT